MENVTIDPSIAAIVNIDPVGVKEVVPVYFTAESNWTGTYKIDVWTTSKKTTKLTLTGSNPVTTAATVLTWSIDPTTQAIPPGVKYYEITHNEANRVIFKGTLNIIE